MSFAVTTKLPELPAAVTAVTGRALPPLELRMVKLPPGGTTDQAAVVPYSATAMALTTPLTVLMEVGAALPLSGMEYTSLVGTTGATVSSEVLTEKKTVLLLALLGKRVVELQLGTVKSEEEMVLLV